MPKNEEPIEPEIQGRVYTQPLPEESAEDFGRRVLAMVKESSRVRPRSDAKD